MFRSSYLHLALLLALVSSTVITAHAKTSHHHLRKNKATAAATTSNRALLSIKQEQNSDQPVPPTVGLPYAEMVEKPSTSSDDSDIIDRHSPALPDRVPHDVELTKVIFVPGNDSTSRGTNDPSLGLPFIVVIGGGTLFVLTAVVIAANKMRNNDDDEDNDEDDEDINDDDVEAADVAKEGSAVTKSAMDFSSIVPGNGEGGASHVSTEVIERGEE
jgi:hypothetical protein